MHPLGSGRRQHRRNPRADVEKMTQSWRRTKEKVTAFRTRRVERSLVPLRRRTADNGRETFPPLETRSPHLHSWNGLRGVFNGDTSSIVTGFPSRVVKRWIHRTGGSGGNRGCVLGSHPQFIQRNSPQPATRVTKTIQHKLDVDSVTLCLRGQISRPTSATIRPTGRKATKCDNKAHVHHYFSRTRPPTMRGSSATLLGTPKPNAVGHKPVSRSAIPSENRISDKVAKRLAVINWIVQSSGFITAGTRYRSQMYQHDHGQ